MSATTGPVLDVALDGRLGHHARVRVRVGGGETEARATWLGGRFHQLRCDGALAVAAGDRIEVVAEDETTMPGVVLDPAADRHGPSNDLLVRLTTLERELAN